MIYFDTKSTLKGGRLRMKIKIFLTPAGQAPEWVRNVWVNVELEATRDIPEENSGYMGVLGGKASSENVGGYKVSVKEAVEEVRKINPEAAE